MNKLFAVVRTRGPAWEGSLPFEEQPEWALHDSFMDGLENDGFVLLGAPLEGTPDVLLIVRAESTAEITQRLSANPWTNLGLLDLKSILPWQLRLGALP